MIERKRDKALLGFCGLIRIPEPDSPMHGSIEIGWRIRQDMWRRGYAFEAASAVLDWGEQKFANQHIVSRIDKDNVASRNLARKLFMRRDAKREKAHAKIDDQLTVFKAQRDRR